MDSFYHYLAAAIVTAAMPVVFAFLKSKGLDLAQDKKDAIDAEAEKAIIYAEEWAAHKIKAGAKDLTAGDKLLTALGFFKRRNPKVDVGDAEDAIHAALPKVRAEVAQGGSYEVPGLR